MLIEDLRVVKKVAEVNSITHAAASLDISAPTASNAVKRVEKALGAELFVRTTRSIRLTQAGESYIQKCTKALSLLELAKNQFVNDEGLIESELRLSISSDLGRNFASLWLNEFQTTYPNVVLKVDLGDCLKDVYKESIDAALRYVPRRSMKESYLYGHKICDMPHILCASPDYLEKYGVPESPEELANHNGLFYQIFGIPHDTWVFEKDDKTYKVKVTSKNSANDGDLVRRWCVAAQGLAIKPCLEVSDDLLTGKLVNIMSEFKPVSSELWLVSPCRQTMTPALKHFSENVKLRCNEILTQLTIAGLLT